MPPGTVVAARRQTAGKGRKARQWISGSTDLTFSFLLRPRILPQDLPTLPMAVALAVRDLLECHGLPAKLKWPNDVLVHDHKICGILCEGLSARQGPLHAVVGVGINIGMPADVCRGIDRPATSIAVERGATVPREEMLAALLPRIGARIRQLEQGGFAALQPHCRRHLYKHGELIQVALPEHRIEGMCLDIGPHGELLLMTAHGTRTILLGEVL